MSADETPIARPLDRSPAWAAVMAHHATIRDVHLRDLFADDPGRAERLTAEGAGLFLDYSKNRVTDESLALLVQLAKESGLREGIDAKRRLALLCGELEDACGTVFRQVAMTLFD